MVKYGKIKLKGREKVPKKYEKQKKLLKFDEKSIIIKLSPNNVRKITIELETVTPSVRSDLFFSKGGQAIKIKRMENISEKETKGLKKDRKRMDVTNLYNQTDEWVLKVCGQEDNVPVNLEKILKMFNIAAMPMDFSDIENRLTGELKDAKILGALVPSGNDTAIFYSDKHEKDSHRNRFTIAHELAHCCIQGQNAHIEFRMDGIELDDMERSANIFAGALLIPEKTLNNIIDRLILPSLHTLADIFEVSENVMLARLKYLGINKNIIGYNM